MPNYSRIPEHMREGVREYLDHGCPPGGFLRAVLENDLKGAAERADIINAQALFDWAVFLVNDMPAHAQGSPEKVKAWIAHSGMEGLNDGIR